MLPVSNFRVISSGHMKYGESCMYNSYSPIIRLKLYISYVLYVVYYLAQCPSHAS